jgi:hypothetical protein
MQQSPFSEINPCPIQPNLKTKRQNRKQQQARFLEDTFEKKKSKNGKTKSSKEQKRINMARSAGSSKWTFSVFKWKKTKRCLLVNVCLVDFGGQSCAILLAGVKLD